MRHRRRLCPKKSPAARFFPNRPKSLAARILRHHPRSSSRSISVKRDLPPASVARCGPGRSACSPNPFPRPLASSRHTRHYVFTVPDTLFFLIVAGGERDSRLRAAARGRGGLRSAATTIHMDPAIVVYCEPVHFPFSALSSKLAINPRHAVLIDLKYP